ncbi:metal ABC transporter solute-binding protein, Zn/Mn family [Trujillonella endophytica]|uniref:Zinc/manganese transport system substrate-binding protein n=1 Tax=Trujillonella endophytica TaxID=673521 RepID=A0A1H8UDT0_9ACTN|nr:zinc ABC transporter substrate-binding protein [Trujillella endophytica]SEP01379.1 zinc/manganese transport system substrate-binding protein [Trujillella endophytica]
MPPARTTVIALAVLAGLAGCSGGDAGPVTETGDPANCPGEVLDVVVSVAQWGSIVDQLGGDCTTVTTVLGSGAGDPHDHEASTGDIAAFEEADLVVYNGAGYDGWAADAAAGVSPRPVVLDVAELAGVGTGEDPHLWYEPELVPRFADAVTAELAELSPDAAPYLQQQRQLFTTELQPYVEALARLRDLSAGRTYGATEPVFDRTAAAVGLGDATPAGYRDAVGNEGEPAPGDLAAFETALTEGRIDVLVYNTQTAGSLPEQLRDAAEAAGVPVVEVTESAPDDEGSFVEWQVDQLDRLSDALAESE